MEEIALFVRPKPVSSGDERTQLETWLAFYRATLLKKCAHMTAENLARLPVEGSSMSLLGLLRHLTFVEQFWFERRFAGREVTPYYRLPDNSDAAWTNLDSATLDEVVALFNRACATSDELARGHELDEFATFAGVDPDPVDLRWIYLHMIEEYARHCGHADLLRELVDGVTGY